MTLDEFEKLAWGATPGPWQSEAAFGNAYVKLAHGRQAELYGVNGRNDADFIAACRSEVPKLIAVVRAAQTLRDNYGGEARDVDLDALDGALAALEVEDGDVGS